MHSYNWNVLKEIKLHKIYVTYKNENYFKDANL